MYLKQRLNACAFFKEGPVVDAPPAEAVDPEEEGEFILLFEFFISFYQQIFVVLSSQKLGRN